MKRNVFYFISQVPSKSLSLGFIFVLFIAHSGYSQSKVPLSQVLSELEVLHNISFSYSDEDVKSITLVPPLSELPLKEKLEYISTNTTLIVEEINPQYYAIRKIKPTVTVTSFCGYLRNIETQTPISLATIQSAQGSTVSNEQGFFELDFSPNMEISIQHLNYESETIQLGAAYNDCEDILLVPKLQILPEVLIPDYLVSGINKMVNGQLFVNTSNLQILPGLVEPDVLFSLQAFPGISSFDESVANINIRGGTNDQNLVLWDGIRMFQTGHFFGLISAFNPYVVDQVTVTKNGTSAEFGDAVSGLLEINSSADFEENFEAQGGINLLNGDVIAKIPITAKTNLQLSARRSVSDIFGSPTFESYADRAFRDTEILSDNADTVDLSNESFDYFDFNVKLNSKVGEKGMLSTSLIHINNDLAHEESGIINREPEFRNSTLTQQSLGYGLHYKHQWNNEWSTTSQFAYSSYELESVNFDIPNDQKLIQNNDISDISLKVNQQYQYNDQISFLAGYRFNESSIGNLEDLDNPDFRRFIKEVLTTHALFGEVSYLSEDMKSQAKLGVRANYYQKLSRTRFEPRLSFNHQLSDALAVEVLAESRSQSLVQVIDLQNDFLGVEKRRWVIVNDEDIPLLTSTQGSIGLQYNLYGWMLNVDGYMKQVDGIITSSQAFQNQFELVRESGSYLVRGLEVLFNKKINAFSSWVSYSFSDNEYVFSPLNTPKFASNFDIPHQLTLGASYKSDHLQVSSNLNWRSGRPFTNPGEPTIINGVINYLSPNTERLDPYLRMDLSGKYWFNLSDKFVMECGLAFWNLANRENQLNTYFRNEGITGARRVENLALGFTPNVMVRVRYN